MFFNKQFEFKISIIIPVYNAGYFIENCINSILNQTYKNFEVILVDDGSTDSSYKICCEFANKFDNVFLLSQDNSGASSARNKGLDFSSGDFVTFIDADDWIDCWFLSSFFESGIVPFDCVVQQGYKQEISKGDYILNRFENAIYKNSSFCNLFLEVDVFGRMPYTHSKLYDNNLIKSYKIRFDDGIRVGEDLVFLLSYLRYSQSCCFIDVCFYNYTFQESSLVRSKRFFDSEIRRFNLCYKLIMCLDFKFNFLEKPNVYFNYLGIFLSNSFAALYNERNNYKIFYRLKQFNFNHTSDNVSLLNNWNPYGIYRNCFKYLFLFKFYICLDIFYLIRVWVKKLSLHMLCFLFLKFNSLFKIVIFKN